MKKLVLISVLMIIAVLAIVISPAGSNYQALADLTCDGDKGVVNKTQGSAFTAEIEFKNIGKIEGEWTVNIAFEGERWTWTGTAEHLILSPANSKTLTWNGNVPQSAPIDSVARLVVYYDDSFKTLDWWIHVVPSAQLTITSSNVK